MKQENYSHLESKDGLEKLLKVTVPQSVVSETFSKSYKKVQKSAHIKGFRRGHVPIDQVKKIYGQQVYQEVLESLVDQYYRKALQEHGIKPILRPDLKVDSFSEDKDLVFTASLEVRPEIRLKKVKKIKVEKKTYKKSDQKIKEMTDRILDSKSTHEPVLEQRGVQDKDVVDIDFEGFIDGKSLKNGTAKNYLLEIGSKNFISGFEEKIKGMKIGELRQVDLNFPDDYFEESLKSKPVTFKVKLNGIKKKKRSELNDAFVQTLGLNLKTVKDFHNYIEQMIQKEETEKNDQELRKKVLDAFVQSNQFPVPQKLKNKQKEHLINEALSKLPKNTSESDKNSYKEKWDKEFEEMAEKSVCLSLLVSELTNEKPELQVSFAEVEQLIKQQGEMMKWDQKRINDLIHSDYSGQLQYRMTEDKVYQYLLSYADIKEV